MSYKGLTVKDALSIGKKTLRDGNISSWSIDCDVILGNVLNLTRTQLITKGNEILNDETASLFESRINRRLHHEPVAYIVNKAEFMGLDFYVDKNVLIPRGDTECVLEPLIEYVNTNACENILDLCTGSGCISVSLAYYGKNIHKIHSVDISDEALKITRLNAEKNQVSQKIITVKSNMFHQLQGLKFDVIVSNPPYIKTGDILELDENVKGYEPFIALDGGNDGLIFYREIANRGLEYLNENGRIYLEIGSSQKDDIIHIFSDYELVDEIMDLSKLDRGLIFRKKHKN